MSDIELGVSKILVEDGTYFWADTRYFPICSVRLFGETTLDLAKTFEAWLLPLVNKAKSEGKKVIIINDFSRSKIPPPVARKYMAKTADALNDNAGFAYWVPVVPSRILRGVLTAVLWMVESDDKRTFYATGLADAVQKCLDLYGDINHPLPEVSPTSYQFPEPIRKTEIKLS